eukprot:6208073-Pleurochrysis_carterae.AAC.1
MPLSATVSGSTPHARMRRTIDDAWAQGNVRGAWFLQGALARVAGRVGAKCAGFDTISQGEGLRVGLLIVSNPRAPLRACVLGQW